MYGMAVVEREAMVCSNARVLMTAMYLLMAVSYFAFLLVRRRLRLVSERLMELGACRAALRQMEC